MKKEINKKNIIAFIQGNIRYPLYYSKHLKRLIPKHIREQIHYRINSMNKECFQRGTCVKCGCRTTHLQMANKACDGKCYPRMLNMYEWRVIKIVGFLKINNELWFFNNGKFKLNKKCIK